MRIPRMKVLMLGWEFPPHFAGGVGIVAAALARSLSARDVMVDYIIPGGLEEFSEGNLRLVVASHRCADIHVARIPGQLTAYPDFEPPLNRAADHAGENIKPLYGPDLLLEMSCFAERLVAWVTNSDTSFDVIHAHDWTTFPAALALKKATGKPVILHVHITEFDKSGGSAVNQTVYEIERHGMHSADRLITVSGRMRDQCVQAYSAPADRIRVIHNAAESFAPSAAPPPRLGGRVVLFIGRVTLQKGPDHFLEAARLVAERMPEIRFVMAGTGDLLTQMIRRAADLGIGSRIFFPGFVSREQVARLLKTAHVFVMPSVSEPFGIVALEAQKAGVPVIVSRQSGAAEVMEHAFKVDFWDARNIASKIIGLLTHGPLEDALRSAGPEEAQQSNWHEVAGRVLDVYNELVH